MYIFFEKKKSKIPINQTPGKQNPKPSEHSDKNLMQKKKKAKKPQASTFFFSCRVYLCVCVLHGAQQHERISENKTRATRTKEKKKRRRSVVNVRPRIAKQDGRKRD